MTKIGQHLRILLSGFLLLGVMPTLSGCTKDLLQNAPFSTRRVNLTETSYAATDMMVQQVNAYITPTTPIEIGTLTDLAYPMAKAPLGRTIPAQVGARLVQPGDLVIICAFGRMEAKDAKKHKPKVILVDSKNRVKK